MHYQVGHAQFDWAEFDGYRRVNVLFARALARLVRPSSGRITIGGADLAELPVAVIGRRIGYVGATPYLFAGSLRDNLLLGLRHIPLRPAEYDEAKARRRARQKKQAAAKPSAGYAARAIAAR